MNVEMQRSETRVGGVLISHSFAEPRAALRACRRHLYYRKKVRRNPQSRGKNLRLGCWHLARRGLKSSPGKGPRGYASARIRFRGPCMRLSHEAHFRVNQVHQGHSGPAAARPGRPRLCRRVRSSHFGLQRACFTRAST